MDNSYAIRIATTIWQQLKDFTDYRILWSWGIENVRTAVRDNQAGVAFEVNGFLFAGTVMITLDEGADLYDICLIRDGEASVVRRGVYCDELGSVIDAIVERTEGMPDDEYDRMVKSAYSA